ncbi:hypothetical protein PX699_02825 [Sphingobium sp. H39-3-25]|uniref:hypothetical protein n=1 Tax=Sphingobium arseniciresistens TaxID=3030834 RepID=UPI0023B9C013|nr:hypothetical protein [Sphingobium arseniciresistens]
MRKQLEGHPNNGGGISIEDDISKIKSKDVKSHNCHISGALVENCFNQGIHISAYGAILENSKIFGTLLADRRKNIAGLFGSNIVVLGKGSLSVSNTDIANSQSHGIALLGGDAFLPSLAFDGRIDRSGGHGMFARNVTSLTVSEPSKIQQSVNGPDSNGIRVDSTYGAIDPYSNGFVGISGGINQSAGAAIAISSTKMRSSETSRWII